MKCLVSSVQLSVIKLQCMVVQHTVQCSAVQYSTVQCSEYSVTVFSENIAVKFNTQCSAFECSVQERKSNLVVTHSVTTKEQGNRQQEQGKRKKPAELSLKSHCK